MRKPLSVLLLVAICSCEKSTHDDRIVATRNLHIKIIKESAHDPIRKGGKFASSSKPSENSFFYETYFDKKGVVIKQNKINLRAILVSSAIFHYDDDGNNIERITHNADGSVELKEVRTYDSKNRLVEFTELDADEKILKKKLVTNDSAGIRTLTSFETSNLRLVKTLESVFDNDNNNVANFYFSKETLTLKEFRRYDANRNVVESLQYFPLTDEQTNSRFKYDEQNNKIEEIVFKNNLATTKTIFKYDEHNNLTEIYRFGVHGQIEEHRKFLFEFDSEGNWTKRIDLFNGKPTSVLVRRIEYY